MCILEVPMSVCLSDSTKLSMGTQFVSIFKRTSSFSRCSSFLWPSTFLKATSNTLISNELVYLLQYHICSSQTILQLFVVVLHCCCDILYFNILCKLIDWQKASQGVYFVYILVVLMRIYCEGGMDGSYKIVKT